MKPSIDRDEIWRRLGKAGKGADGALAYTRLVNRPLANHIVVLLAQLDLTPNQLTIFGFLLTSIALGVISAFWSSFAVVLAGVFFLLLAYVIDLADGRLSRVLGLSSAYGEWLDHSLDVLKLVFVQITCVYIVWSGGSFPQPAVFVLCLGAVLANVGYFFSTMLRGKLVKIAGRREPDPVPASLAKRMLRDVILLPFDYGAFCLLFLLAPWPQVFAAAYALWVAGGIVRFVGSMRRSRRILRQLAAD